MKAMKLLLLTCFLMFLQVEILKAQIVVSARSQPGPPQNFEGSVLVQRLAIDSTDKWMVSRVVFKPKSWSRWHTHPGKQVVVATDGEGYIKIKGKPLRKLVKGDVVDILPGLKHWHGATPNSQFVQLVVNPDTKNGVVTWMEPVTLAEYNELKK